MDRRNAIATLSGAVAASALLALPRRPALAQTTTTGLTLDAGSYKTHTLLVGTLAKQTSQIALTRGSNPKLKEFAQFEVDEQTAIAQVLTDTTNPPPAPLDPTHAAMLAQLQQAPEGRAFDAAYVQGQIKGHQELFAIQQAFLNGVPTDHDREHIAVLARTVIQMHLTMLQDLQVLVGSA